MKKLDILKDPNPLLREQAQPVESFDGATQELIDNMVYTMRQADGIGLAAPQIGELKQIIVGEFESEDEKDNTFPLTVVVNPKILNLSKEKIFMLEGCLSFPGKELYIKRPKEIEIEAQDRWGKPVKIKSGNLFSRVLQHEIDHLNGLLMIDHIKTVKTIFIGNGTLGVFVLEKIFNDPQFKLLEVISGKPKPAGRGRELKDTPIGVKSMELGVKIFRSDGLNRQEAISHIRSLSPEMIVLADFNEVISREILDIPKYGVINVHPSLLPKFRGPSPIVSAILAGEKKTGVSLILMNEKIDAGDILAQIHIRIKSRETAEQLKIRLAEISADLLAEAVPYYLAGEISPIKQKEEKATSTSIISKSDGELIGNEAPEVVDRMVRALLPWPGVYQVVSGRKIFITKAHLDKEKKLVIDRVKPEGKNDMQYSDFCRGNSDRLIFSE